MKKTEDKVIRFFHCANCIRQKPPGQSYQDWSKIEAGVTERGHIKISCFRCDLEIVRLIDAFDGKVN